MGRELVLQGSSSGLVCRGWCGRGCLRLVMIMHHAFQPRTHIPPSSGIKPNVSFVSSLEPKHNSSTFGRRSGSAITAPLQISRPGLGDKGLSALCSSGTFLFITVYFVWCAALTSNALALVAPIILHFCSIVMISSFLFLIPLHHSYHNAKARTLPSLWYQAQSP
jgi:hypothetical protein